MYKKLNVAPLFVVTSAGVPVPPTPAVYVGAIKSFVTPMAGAGMLSKTVIVQEIFSLVRTYVVLAYVCPMQLNVDAVVGLETLNANGLPEI